MRMAQWALHKPRELNTMSLSDTRPSQAERRRRTPPEGARKRAGGPSEVWARKRVPPWRVSESRKRVSGERKRAPPGPGQDAGARAGEWGRMTEPPQVGGRRLLPISHGHAHARVALVLVLWRMLVATGQPQPARLLIAVSLWPWRN